MGLDVYLYKYSDYQKSQENEKAYDKYSEMLYSSIEGIEDFELVKEAKEGIKKKLEDKATELGLGEWGEDVTHKKRIELDSVLHPDHYFKIGYFRSSYNGSGINCILRDLSIPDLYDIFKPNEEYSFSPDWNHALTVVEKSIKMYKKDKGFRVVPISGNIFSPDDVPVTGAAAMKIFNQNLKRNGKSEHTAYSNRDGEFYLDTCGLQVHGLIPGKGFMDKPCTYVVYKDMDGHKFILNALEVVKETIEYVLASGESHKFYLSWSA